MPLPKLKKEAESSSIVAARQRLNELSRMHEGVLKTPEGATVSYAAFYQREMAQCLVGLKDYEAGLDAYRKSNELYEQALLLPSAELDRCFYGLTRNYYELAKLFRSERKYADAIAAYEKYMSWVRAEELPDEPAPGAFSGVLQEIAIAQLLMGSTDKAYASYVQSLSGWKERLSLTNDGRDAGVWAMFAQSLDEFAFTMRNIGLLGASIATFISEIVARKKVLEFERNYHRCEAVANVYEYLGDAYSQSNNKINAFFSYKSSIDLHYASIELSSDPKLRVAGSGAVIIQKQIERVLARSLSLGEVTYDAAMDAKLQTLVESKNPFEPPSYEQLVWGAPVGLEDDVNKSPEQTQIEATKLPDAPPKLWTRRTPGRRTEESRVEGDNEVIAFIREVYGPYLKNFKGKLYAYIRKHDPALFGAISNLKRNKRLPADVYISSRDENVDDLIAAAKLTGRKGLKAPDRRKVTGALSRRTKKPDPQP